MHMLHGNLVVIHYYQNIFTSKAMPLGLVGKTGTNKAHIYMMCKPFVSTSDLDISFNKIMELIRHNDMLA